MSENVEDNVGNDGEVPLEEETGDEGEPEDEEEEETCSWCGENPCVCAETAEAA
jgi:hypothetical protein